MEGRLSFGSEARVHISKDGTSFDGKHPAASSLASIFEPFRDVVPDVGS
jgi:hypothetical protein